MSSDCRNDIQPSLPSSGLLSDTALLPSQMRGCNLCAPGKRVAATKNESLVHLQGVLHLCRCLYILADQRAASCPAAGAEQVPCQMNQADELSAATCPGQHTGVTSTHSSTGKLQFQKAFRHPDSKSRSSHCHWQCPTQIHGLLLWLRHFCSFLWPGLRRENLAARAGAPNTWDLWHCVTRTDGHKAVPECSQVRLPSHKHRHKP